MKNTEKLRQAKKIINMQNVVLKVVLGSMDEKGNISMHLRKQGLLEIIEESQFFIDNGRVKDES